MDDPVHGEDGGLKLLLTVEQTFEIKGRGLIVVPGPLATAFKRPVELGVELRLPDGSRRHATLHLQYVFLTPPPKEQRYACIFRGLSKAEVPIGTEIYYTQP